MNSLQLARQVKGKLSLKGNWYWAAYVMAMLIAFPWILFFTDALIPSVESSTVKIYALLTFAAISLSTILLICHTRILEHLRRKTSILLALSFLLIGIASFLVSSLASEGYIELNEASTLGLTIAGAGIAAMGYSLLLAKWALTSYARIQPGNAHSIVSLAALLAIALCLLLSVVLFPFGYVIVAACYLVVFAIADNKIGSKDYGEKLFVGTISRAGAIVMQNGIWPNATIAVITFACGFELTANLSGSPGYQDAAYFSWTVLLSSLFLILLIIVITTLRRQSLLLNLLMASIALGITGSTLTSSIEFRAIGQLILSSGFYTITVFYFVFFNAVCQRKDCSRKRMIAIFWHTMTIILLSIVTSVVSCFAILHAFPEALSSVGLATSFAMVFITLAIFYTEINSTRRELADKSESTVSLASVRNFALEQGSQYGLTDRECEVIHLLMCGRSVSSAAKDLCLAESTVKTHIRSIYQKLDVHNRQEMIGLVMSKLFQ